MTKGGGFACGAGRHHRAACHLGIVDEDSITEPCHPLSALGKRQLVQSRWHTLTKRLDSLGQGCHIDMLLCLDIELPQLLRYTLLGLSHLLSSTLKLLSLDHLRQVYIEQPRLLAFELRQNVTQRLPPRLQGLGQPGAPLGPFQFMGDEGRLPQDTAEVLPYQRIQGMSGGIARRAAFAEGEPQRIGTAPTAVIMVARVQGATAAREPTLATAD